VIPPRYALDDRAVAAIVAELRALATAEYVPGLSQPGPGPPTPVPWSDILFPGGQLQVAEPSGALLHAFAELYPGLLQHLSVLPERALTDWLERRLGIARLAVVPDTVVAVPKPDPKRLPVLVPPGTALRGGRDAAGNERRYVTTETLTVLGVEVLDIRSYRRAGESVAESRGTWTNRSSPFDPFPLGVEVPHYADIATNVIAFEGGSLNVRLQFEGATHPLPPGLRWWHSTKDGLVKAHATAQSGEVADVQLAGSCAPLKDDPAGLPFIRVALPEPPYPQDAFDLSFTGVTAEVVVRETVKPDAGFYNDGIVDITKEFQPFGPVAKRGDSFYIQSEEAFSKPLRTLSVTLDVLGDGQMYEVAWGGGYPQFIKVAIKAYEEESKSTVEPFFIGGTKDTGAARVAWQRYNGTAWDEFYWTDDVLRSIDPGGLAPLPPAIPDGPKPYSRPVQVGGVTGRMVRAFLDRGDFGWTDYQNRIARFAAQAAITDGNPQPSDLIAPDPPIVSTVTLAYTTWPAKVMRVRSVDGWVTRDHQPGDLLFFLPPTASPSIDAAGEIGIGLGLAEPALGSAVSLFVDIDPATACTTSSVTPETAWEYWTQTQGWRPLDVVDGTSGLRQAGLVRFVASLDWASGSPEFSADAGRWVRIVTNLPERFGTIRSIVPDAVVAEYRSQLPDPGTDPAPETALGALELKGLMAPITGIKTFSNPLPGTVGRGPEPDGRYVRRAAERIRHRNRAVQAWDYEAIVSSEFPEVATVRCLPHTNASDDDVTGSVGLVIVPWSHEPQPAPSVSLAERILAALDGQTPVHASPVVLCPLYQGVSVEAKAVLRPGYNAPESKRTLGAAIDEYLHPGADAPFGRELFASTLVRFLESRPEVDHVTTFLLVADPCPTGATGAPCVVERVSVDPCRGLIASTGKHLLTLTEQL
jgi:hypothetical protein